MNPDQPTTTDEKLQRLQATVESHEKLLASITPVLTTMTNQLGEIKTALVGDNFGNKGFVGRFEESRADRADLRKIVEAHDRKLLTWGGAGAAFLLGFEVLKDKLFK